MSHQYYLFYKPYNVLSQFTPEVNGQACLADYISISKDVYAVGRLDFDSEGLLFLTNDKKANAAMLDPMHKVQKTYYVQVEGVINDDAITQLCRGVTIRLPNKSLYKTLPCQVKKIDPPLLSERTPPIRYRAQIPTTWISITIIEGKNRQVRKMCAAVGFPVLRLVRYALGDWNISDMAVGELKSVDGWK